MKYELIEHTGYNVSPARDIIYRIRYEDNSWLGKIRLVRTKKAAKTFHDINRARKGAIDMEGEWPSSELLKTWKIIVEKKTFTRSIWHTTMNAKAAQIL